MAHMSTGLQLSTGGQLLLEQPMQTAQQLSRPLPRCSVTPGKGAQSNLQNTEATPSTTKKSNLPSKTKLPVELRLRVLSHSQLKRRVLSLPMMKKRLENERPTDGDNSGSEEEEDSGDEDDNLPSIDDRDVDTEEERSAKALYDAKKSLPDSTRRSLKMEEIEQALYRVIHPSIKEVNR